MTRTLLLLFLLALTLPAAAQDAGLDVLAGRVAEAPDDADARRRLAEGYLAAGTPERALPHVSWLAAQAPTDAALLRHLADLYLWTDRPADAAEVLDRLVRVDPSDAGARLRLADLVMWTGGADRALAVLAPLVDDRPDDPAVQKAFAFALHAAGNEAAARRQYTRALGLLPDDALLLLESGALERWTGDWAEGHRRLVRALQLDLDAAQRDRARGLVRGIDRQFAPVVESRVSRVTDSNGLTRVSTPLRVAYTLGSRWSVGGDVGWERVATDRATTLPSAVAVGVAPFVVLTPSRRVSARASLGVESSPGGRLAPTAALRVERTWAGRRFALARAEVVTQTAIDGVDAIEQGLRRTDVSVVGYAEPAPGIALDGQAAAFLYADDNTRTAVGAGLRAMPLVVGARPDGAPSRFTAGATVAARYEDSRRVHPDARPYYTPERLATVQGGLALTLAPRPRYTAEGTVGASRQSGPGGAATSLYYRAAFGLTAGRHALALDLARTGSAVYADDTVTLRYRIQLW